LKPANTVPLVPKLESTTSARVKAWKKKPLRRYSTGTDEREDHQSIQRRRSNERKPTHATRKRQGSCTRCRGTGELTFKGFQQERRHKSLKRSKKHTNAVRTAEVKLRLRTTKGCVRRIWLWTMECFWTNSANVRYS
jgi:hypothetical protein